MIILTVRTDKPEAEIGLYNDTKQLIYETWQAHRRLAETVHYKIQALLESQHLSLNDLDAVVCFQGPGSFTGLRIGLTVANTLAYSYMLPIVAIQGPNWIDEGIRRVMQHETDELALPFYGADAHITLPRK